MTSTIYSVNGVEQVQVRKLLNVGNSGHGVSIPNRWIEKLGFGEGKQDGWVRMELLDNSSIVMKRMELH